MTLPAAPKFRSPMTTDTEAPHQIEWLEGTPFSRIYGDRFYSRSGAVEERQMVFLEGNRLPERFAQCGACDHFVVGETGFGTGLNFLLTAALWLKRAPATAHLHYLSVEAHPLSRTDLELCHGQWPDLEPIARQLHPHWDTLLRGTNHLRLCEGRVTLQLLIGDVSVLGQYSARCDAWYLDGFAPDRNPAMWSEATMRLIAERSAAGATCATYSAAGHMRRALESYGYRTGRLPGHGGKRHRTVGTRTDALAVPDAAPWYSPPTPRAPSTALVLGAGLAGAWVARLLATRGCSVTVSDPAGIAQGASGNAAAIVVPQVSANDNTVHGWHATGFALTRRLLADSPYYRACGVLHTALDDDSRTQCLHMLDWWNPPASVARWVEPAEGSALAGLPRTHGGLWFAGGGVQRTPELCQALLDHRQIQVVAEPAYTPTGYDITIVATAFVPERLRNQLRLPIAPARGQIESMAVSTATENLRCVLSGAGYVTPAHQGLHTVGASYVRDSTDLHFSAAEQQEIFARAQRLLHAPPGATLASRVALRATTADHLPLVGPVPDWDGYAHLYGDLARGRPGTDYGPAGYQPRLWVSLAHGSRGAVSAPLAAELLIAQIYGLPLPVALSLAHAVHPGRFAIRAWRSGRDYKP